MQFYFKGHLPQFTHYFIIIIKAYNYYLHSLILKVKLVRVRVRFPASPIQFLLLNSKGLLMNSIYIFFVQVEATVINIAQL